MSNLDYHQISTETSKYLKRIRDRHQEDWVKGAISYTAALEKEILRLEGRERGWEELCRTLEDRVHFYRAKIPSTDRPTRTGKIRKKPQRTMPRDAYGLAVLSASDRKLQWAIPEADYYRLVSCPCHYCSRFLGERGVRLDRVDSKAHYSLDNVVPCCARCNMVKNRHLNLRQMEAVGEVLRKLDME